MDSDQNVTRGMALALAGVVVYAALVVWARRPGHTARSAMLVAATGGGLVVGGMNALAATLGWWAGHWAYSLPLPLRTVLFVLWPAILFVPVLAGYRWLVAHARWPRLVYGLIVLVVLTPWIAFIDSWALETHQLSFGGGYAIWHDVLLGQALLWLPVLFYEAAQRRWHAPASERAARTGSG